MAKNNMEGGGIRLTLRLPEYLHAALEADANNETRSLNNQIIHALKQVYPNAQKDFSNSKPASTGGSSN